MRWESFAVTDPGLQRPNNEDAYLDCAEAGLFAVADGMGGHAAGEVASRMAIETLAREACRPGARHHASQNLATPLLRAISAANRELRRIGRDDPDKRGMGTTLSVLAGPPDGSRGVIAHVGDSRIYRLRDGRLERLTRDHTWVQERVDAGVLTPEQARSHPYASILTRVLGTDERVEPDVIPVVTAPDDLFLLCSDGLPGMVEDEEIGEIMARDDPLPVMGERLIEAAKSGGGLDNVTLILARVTD